MNAVTSWVRAVHSGCGVPLEYRPGEAGVQGLLDEQRHPADGHVRPLLIGGVDAAVVRAPQMTVPMRGTAAGS